MLTPERFTQLVAALPYKKVLPDAVYLHKETLATTSPQLYRFVCAVAQALKLPECEWDLVKLAKQEFRLSLLSYPTFFEEAYPSLKQSVTVDLAKLSHSVTRYDSQDNPPILHRKECMLTLDHPQAESCRQITEEGELAGLYDHPRMIGFKASWERLIARHGYQLVDGRLFRISALPPEEGGPQIDRHKTALVRHELSAPMKMLARHGYLNGHYALFDYGCGRGDDLRELEAHGIDALGWDPNFRPDGEKVISHLVNLGFVINVIEDQDERMEALLGAWELTQTLLVVSAMLANDSFIAQFTPYKDGVITSRNTFQRYYNQSELKHYIDKTLDENAIAVGPGIFYVFKDKLEEQRFLAQRQRRSHSWQQLTSPTPNHQATAALLITRHQPLFEAFWQRALTLGRIPTNDEFEQSDELREIAGSHRKAMTLLGQHFDLVQLKQAELERQQDLLVYLALNLFGKRQAYTQYPSELQRDIKAFFGGNPQAQQAARALLYQIADIALINQACELAHQQLPNSLLYPSHSLLLHKCFIPQLPPLLRVYLGAACQLYGDLTDIDVIKLHIRSGKVSLMGYDDFSKPIPHLVVRVKIKMAEQEVDFFDYINEQTRPPLLNKSYLMAPDDPSVNAQRALEQRLSKLLGMDLETEHHLSRQQYESALKEQKRRISGFRICSVKE